MCLCRIYRRGSPCNIQPNVLSMLTFEQNSKPISNYFENSEKLLNNFIFFQNSEQFPKQLGLFSRIWKIFKQHRIFFQIRLISCPYTALKRYVIMKKKKNAWKNYLVNLIESATSPIYLGKFSVFALTVCKQQHKFWG